MRSRWIVGATGAVAGILWWLVGAAVVAIPPLDETDAPASGWDKFWWMVAPSILVLVSLCLLLPHARGRIGKIRHGE